jgi:hypothetical protein
MGDHVHAKIATPGGQQAIEYAEGSNDHDSLPSLIAVSYAKNDPLQEDRNPDAAGKGVELLLKIAAENDLFAEAGSEAKENP